MMMLSNAIAGFMSGVIAGLLIIAFAKVTRWGWARGREIGLPIYKILGYVVALVAGYFTLFIVIIIPVTAVIGNIISIFALPSMVATIWYFRARIQSS